MGRKDASKKTSNIETYRKKIGKQEYKRTKGAVKSLKDAADAKRSAIGVKDVVLVLLGIFVLLSSIYLMFLYSFNK